MFKLENCDNERLKILLGFALGFILMLTFAVLALSIALGTVRAETSYGLGMVLGGLNTAIGGFAGWAWSNPHPKKTDQAGDTPQEGQPPAT